MENSFLINKRLEINYFMSAFEQSLGDGFVFSGESHDFWEFVYVTDGEVYATGDERVFLLSKGEIIFHKPNELHKLRVDRGKSAKIYVSSFSMSGEDASFFENLTVKLSGRQKEAMDNILLHLKENADVTPRELYDYLRRHSSVPHLLHKLSCLTEMFLLSLLSSHAPNLSASESPDAIIFRKAVTIMDSKTEENLKIDDIAKMCNISPSYLKKIFLRFSGFGVHKYFLKLKIIRAQNLLENGHTVSDVSDMLGFSSQNYFSVVFKRETSLSPLEYKKSL